MPKPPTKPTFERYGLQWDKSQVNDLNLELACYSDPKLFPTGKPREFHFRQAWKIVWPKYEWNEWAEMIVWAWCNYRIITIIGHTSSTKSHTTAHTLLLDYLAAPPLTSITVTTTKFDALRSRIWGDVMQSIETSAMRSALLEIFKVTTTSNELKIGMRSADNIAADKYLIQGVATDSADEAASKLRGQHTERRRIVADECEDMGEALYTAIDNARVDTDFVAALLTNPRDRSSVFNQKWACPKNGWGSVSPMDLFWETVQPDGICLHFDGLQSPNIKAKRTIFPYMLTQKYVDDLKATEGDNSVKWWMFVRGFPAPDGVIAKIWPEASLNAAKANVEFDFDPTPCAALDPAFDSDDCVIHFGEIGRLRGTDQQCCRVKETIKLKLDEDPRIVPKDFQVAKQVKAMCLARGVKPENFIMDETGNARGVLAILSVDWSPKVHGIHYGGEATKRPLRPNDIKPANEQVKLFVTELWFRAAYLAQAGLLVGLQNCHPNTYADLASRQYELKQYGTMKLMVANPKSEMRERLGRSPDYGDAFCQFGELMARQGMLQAAGTAAPKSIWAASRKLAIKAAKRYAEPVHGAA